MADVILPNPVFEGSEKRVEIDFALSAGAPSTGLRALSRDQLDELMTLAACTIVSSRSNAYLDAYVLSESSLFVYPTKWVLKTCGTTKLLNAVPRLLELATELGMQPRRCKYSRASFLFPDQQPFPHTSFDHEAFFLRRHFGHLGNGGSAYVLGDMFNGLQWHVYVADASGTSYEPLAPLPAIESTAASGSTTAMETPRPTYKLEVCMTGLAKHKAALFFREGGDRTTPFVSAARTTEESGIAGLLPGAIIDDYVFEPCGYSMNGIRGRGFMTVHITPEDGFSYASVEVSGFDASAYEPTALVAAITRVFLPAHMSVSLSVDAASRTGGYSWGTLAAAPPGYGCQSATCQELAAGGRVSFYTLSPSCEALVSAFAAASTMPAPAPAPAAVKAAALARPPSPGTLLRHMPSFSGAPSDSDVELLSSGSGDEAEARALRAWGKTLVRVASPASVSSDDDMLQLMAAAADVECVSGVVPGF